MFLLAIDPINAKNLLNYIHAISLKIKIFCVLIPLLIAAIILYAFKYNQIHAEQVRTTIYMEFIFEADQLNSLTGYGVTKADFTKQLARAKAKYSAIPHGTLSEYSERVFKVAIAKWEEAAQIWDTYELDVQIAMQFASNLYSKAKEDYQKDNEKSKE